MGEGLDEMKVFVVAMKCEAEAVVRNLTGARTEMMFGREVVRGTLCGEETAVVVGGIGKSNAAASAQLALSSLDAGTLLNVGVAGGLDPQLRVGDILRVARTMQYDFDLSKINGTPVGTLDECRSPFYELSMGGDWPEATVATGDRFSDDVREAELLRTRFGANVCEMELGAIAHTAFRARVPLYSWKAISDVVGRGTQAEQYKVNLARCLDILAAAVPGFFASVQ